MILVDTFKKLKKVAWFVPGFLLWASFPPMAEVTDSLFALAPLLWLSRQGNARESVRRWTQSGLFFWVATLSWMPAIVKNGGPWPLVVLGWGALAAYCTAYFAAFGWLSATYWSRARSGNLIFRLLGVLLVEPILWCGLELVRSRFLGGFAWNQLGVVPANAGFGAPAALGGVYLLSAVVILVNGTLAGIAERIVASVRRQPVSRLRTVETVLAFALVWGIYRAAAPYAGADESAKDVVPLRVALVQRNFPCVFSVREEDPRGVYERLLANVLPLKPDLILLPESAMCEFGPVDSPRAVDFADDLARRSGAVLAGGTRFGDGVTYNCAALYRGDGRPKFYDKVHLVPFGEFIPGDKWFPVLQKLAPVGSCTPGEEKLLSIVQPSTSDLQPSTFGVAICFEDTDSALMRRAAEKGARFLCFITNDSWFSHSNEAVAHAWQATARAIETGLPVFRVGNSGVTGTILPNGRVNWLVGANGKPLVDRQATLFDRVKVPAAPRQTPYVRLGDTPLFIAFTILLLGLLTRAVRIWYNTRNVLVG